MPCVKHDTDQMCSGKKKCGTIVIEGWGSDYLKNLFDDKNIHEEDFLSAPEKLDSKIREEWEKEKETNYKITKKRYDLITKYIKTFQLLPDREVKEIYDTIDASEPKGTKIIIVDGIEKGAYWLTTEYMKDNA